MTNRFKIVAASLLLVVFVGVGSSRLLQANRASAAPSTPNPILFVTQIPIAADFTTIGSTFGNHMADLRFTGRGGDLYIRYTDGTLKNLTAAAGFGGDGFLTTDAIAVRDPAVHWDGQKAVFSMVVGGPAEQYNYNQYRWQIYEISGLGQNDTPIITKVPNQPKDFNNVSPIYGSTDQIIFTSDRPRNGADHLYPQRDEYESAPTNTGLWSLVPETGELTLLNHAPSGDFSPFINSQGQIVFTQWDHLQRDQLADIDFLNPQETSTYGAFNYSSESATAEILTDQTEIFPEPRTSRADLLEGTEFYGHSFNHFFPWTINQDGTESEILLHLGRHELHSYIPYAILDDNNVTEYYGQYERTNPNPILNMFHIEEDPTTPQTYFGTDAPEFRTHSAGFLISIAAQGKNADQVAVNYVTDPANSDGRYREPLPLSDGSLLAVYSSQTANESGSGFDSDYEFRLVNMVADGTGRMTAGEPLTSGINKTVSYWNPDQILEFSGEMWELNPVEVKARPRPVVPTSIIKTAEQQMFDEAGVTVEEMRDYLEENNLALLITRNVTSRDDLDRQQPFNLRVPNGGAQSVGADGEIYDVARMQFFQGEQLRGHYVGRSEPRDGRRVIPQPMPMVRNPDSSGPESSTVIAADGSVAAFVPAQRALSWQLLDPDGNPVVRERYWLTFQPGEIRSCGSCHGASDKDQTGGAEPENAPQALAELLEHWQTLENVVYTDSAFLPTVRR